MPAHRRDPYLENRNFFLVLRENERARVGGSRIRHVWARVDAGHVLEWALLGVGTIGVMVWALMTAL